MKKHCLMLIVILVPALALTGCSPPISPGTVQSGTYTNPDAGFGFRLDENWLCSDSDPFDLLLENASIQSGIRITHTRLTAAERLACRLHSEEQEVDSIVAQKEQIIQQYETGGISISSLEKGKILFLGEPHFVLRCEAAMDGIPYYILHFHNFDAGAYGFTLTVFSFYQDHTLDILEQFYPIGNENAPLMMGGVFCILTEIAFLSYSMPYIL